METKQIAATEIISKIESGQITSKHKLEREKIKVSHLDIFIKIDLVLSSCDINHIGLKFCGLIRI